MKLFKGQTYLQQIEKDGNMYFYIIMQAGERSWSASLFSHHINHGVTKIIPVITGNSSTIVDNVLDDNKAEHVKMNSYTPDRQADMRICMSNIFLNGEI